MKKPIKNKELDDALHTVAKWFISENQKAYKKPITMIDSDVELGGEHFRLITHFAFWGRNEMPYIVDKEDTK